MAANAMWFQGDNGDGGLFTLTIGPITITYYQLYSSFLSALMVFPVALLIVVIFRNTDPTSIMSLKEALSDYQAFKHRNKVHRGTQAGHEDDEDDLYDVYDDEPEYIWLQTTERHLPYVCVYVAWGLCLLICLTAAFFTFMYSLEWGGEKSNVWLIAFFLSTIQDIGVISVAQVSLLLIHLIAYSNVLIMHMYIYNLL